MLILQTPGGWESLFFFSSWYLPSHRKSLSWWEACVALYHLSYLMHNHDMIFETELQQSWNFSGRNKMTITMLSLSFFTIFSCHKVISAGEPWLSNPQSINCKGILFFPVSYHKTVHARNWMNQDNCSLQGMIAPETNSTHQHS